MGAKIAGMRNVLTHGYFSIDAEQVHYTVTHDLPALKSVAVTILASRAGEG